MLDNERLKLLIAEGEGLTVEFKEQYTAKIDRDIVAFANTKGGYILLGVADNGKITGQKLNNKIKSEIHSLARNCEPSIRAYPNNP
jgi:ATP-dependent DNA helicase RecG